MLRSVPPASQQPALQPGSQSAKSVGELARPQPSVWPGEENEMAVCSIHGRWARVLQEKNPLHHTRPTRPAFLAGPPGSVRGARGRLAHLLERGTACGGAASQPGQGGQEGPGKSQGCRPPVATTQPAQDAAPGNSDAMCFQIDVVQRLLAEIQKVRFLPATLSAAERCGLCWCFVATQNLLCFFWGLRFHPQLQAA